MDDADRYSEDTVLLAYLRRVRDAVVRATEGRTEEEARRPGVPAGTSLVTAGHADILREQIDGATGP